MPPPPPFESFLFDALNSEQEPCKKTIDQADQKPVSSVRGRFWNLRVNRRNLKFTGRVEKVLTGSISGSYVLVAR